MLQFVHIHALEIVPLKRRGFPGGAAGKRRPGMFYVPETPPIILHHARFEHHSPQHDGRTLHHVVMHHRGNVAPRVEQHVKGVERACVGLDVAAAPPGHARQRGDVARKPGQHLELMRQHVDAHPAFGPLRRVKPAVVLVGMPVGHVLARMRQVAKQPPVRFLLNRRPGEAVDGVVEVGAARGRNAPAALARAMTSSASSSVRTIGASQNAGIPASMQRSRYSLCW